MIDVGEYHTLRNGFQSSTTVLHREESASANRYVVGKSLARLSRRRPFMASALTFAGNISSFESRCCAIHITHYTHRRTLLSKGGRDAVQNVQLARMIQELSKYWNCNLILRSKIRPTPP